MRLEKMANIVLTEEEVKRAIKTWLFYCEPKNDLILGHLSQNLWTIETNENGEFVICVDGIIETEEV